VEADIVSVEPFETFETRWMDKVSSKQHDFIFTSQVFFNSGLECPALSKWIPFAGEKTLIAIDGYHAFCAIPTDLKKFQDRIFYLAGGYKYAQAGEGICFMVVPKHNHLRPLNTGWFADFAALNKPETDKITYATDGMQFAGSTFDASGCYRFNSVCKMLENEKLNVAFIHTHVMEVKKYFLQKIKEQNFAELPYKNIIFKDAQQNHITEAHFATFKTPRAQELQYILEKNHVIVDSRGDRLRFGFGLYHDLKSVDMLIKKLSSVFSKNVSTDNYEKSAQRDLDL
jgi:selenocysteine lyase/cysteine desulfurase